MGFKSISELVGSAYEQGKTWYSSFRKVPPIASTAGSVIDLSSSPGNPRPNYYVGDALVAKTLTSAYGIWHGGDVLPATKHLHKILLNAFNAGVVPANFWLLDYLLFYPLIDMDSTDDQEFDNTVTLPRYTDGRGVMAFLVATNPYIGGATFTINYTNHLGQSRTSAPIVSNLFTTIATVVHSGIVAGTTGAFLKLAPGDFVRSVESITFLAPNGGLAALVLCKPLANGYLREVGAPAEWDFMTMKPNLPRIYDGAYLNFLCQPNGSVAAQPIFGSVEVVWN